MATYISHFSELDLERLNRILSELESLGRKDLEEEGFAPQDIEIQRSMEIRYADQIHECTVPIPFQGELSQEYVDKVKELFHRRHEEIYTYCEPDNEPELVNVEVNAIGLTRASSRAAGQVEANGAGRPTTTKRRAYFHENEDYVEVPVYDGRQIKVGDSIPGPAIIEETTTTIVVFPDWKIELKPASYYFMTR